VHILLHLADSAKKLGPLQNHSAYKTENELGLIIKMNKCKNNYAALEISSKYRLQSGLRKHLFNLKEKKLSKEVKEILSSYCDFLNLLCPKIKLRTEREVFLSQEEKNFFRSNEINYKTLNFLTSYERNSCKITTYLFSLNKKKCNSFVQIDGEFYLIHRIFKLNIDVLVLVQKIFIKEKHPICFYIHFIKKIDSSFFIFDFNKIKNTVFYVEKFKETFENNVIIEF